MSGFELLTRYHIQPPFATRASQMIAFADERQLPRRPEGAFLRNMFSSQFQYMARPFDTSATNHNYSGSIVEYVAWRELTFSVLISTGCSRPAIKISTLSVVSPPNSAAA